MKNKPNTKSYAPLCSSCKSEVHAFERILRCACGWEMKVFGRSGSELVGKSYRFLRNHEKKDCKLSVKERKAFRASLRWMVT